MKPARRSPRSARTAAPWRVPAIYFALGLVFRILALRGSHFEGDEIVHRILVHQLETGQGYTLHGTPLLGTHWPAEMYDKPLFHHPPGGIALFWMLHFLLGNVGFAVAQLLSYAAFFWGMLSLAGAVCGPLKGHRLHLAAALAAFTPIMSHVMQRYWLDGPMLGFSTLAGALFIAAAARGSLSRTVNAGLVMGYASWIKTSSFMIVPGLLLLAWALAAPEARRRTFLLASVFVGLALLIQLPWEIWQWLAQGSPFPAWAGRPSPQLIAENPYVRFVTVTRPPWVYLQLLPVAVCTVIPSILCLLLGGLAPRTRRIGLALIGWMGFVLAVDIALGFIGYSKLLRYAVLLTPATVLLFTLTAGEVWDRLTGARASKPRRAEARPSGSRSTESLLGPTQRVLLRALVVLAMAGFALEIAQGMYSPILDPHSVMIRPLLLPRGQLL